MKKNNLLTIRIDNHTTELIGFLKEKNIRYTDIIRESIDKTLENVCDDFGKEDDFKYPF